MEKKTRLRIILMGPPGSGKGTQATQIAEKLNVQSVSSGELFRDQLGRGTELGFLAQTYMDQGVYVPDDVTIKMVMVMTTGVTGGINIEGFSRYVDKIEEFFQILCMFLAIKWLSCQRKIHG